MYFLYNVLYIYSVSVGHTTYTKPWANTHYNNKLWAEFSKLRVLRSAMFRMAVALFDFLTVAKFLKLHSLSSKLGSFPKAEDLGSNTK